MANPQAEDGHVDIANEIVEALARTRISGTEMQLLWVIIRKTYGWHKKEDSIPLSQFSEMTGISKPHTIRYLKKLLHKKIIVVAQKGNGVTNYSINKDFETWEPLPKKATLHKKATDVAQKGNEHCTKRQKSLPKKGPSKEKKETIQKKLTKEKRIYGSHVELTLEEYEKLSEKYADQVTSVIEFFDLKIESKGIRSWRKEHVSDYATILFWDRNGWIRLNGGTNGNGTNRTGSAGQTHGYTSKAAHLGDGQPFPDDLAEYERRYGGDQKTGDNTA